MDMDIKSLVTYPMASDDWVATILIGGGALLLSVLVVPIFAITGYLVRVIRAGMDGATEPPVFDEWKGLLLEGFFAAVIGLIYQIIPIVVFIVFVGGSLQAALTGSSEPVGAGLLGAYAGLLLSWALSIVFAYVGLAGIANYARKGRFGDGFDFGVIGDVVTSLDYLVAWAYVFVLDLVVGIVTAGLNFVPIVGAIVAVFVSFYALVIAGWLWGNGFAKAIGMPSRTDTGPGTTAL